MFLDVEIKFKKKNKLLFSKESKSLQSLIQLMKEQNHRTLIMWALDCAKLPLKEFEDKYSHEGRPRICLTRCEEWSKGSIKMPVAKRAILEAHAVAKEINDPIYAALCHAIGHAGGTVHVATHALGLPIYELTAIVLSDKDNYQKLVMNKINYYEERLLWWQGHIDQIERSWASFLI